MSEERIQKKQDWKNNNKLKIYILCFLGVLILFGAYMLLRDKSEDERKLEKFIRIFAIESYERQGLEYDNAVIREKYKDIQTIYIPQGKIRFYDYRISDDSDQSRIIIYEYPSEKVLGETMRKNPFLQEGSYGSNGRFLIHSFDNMEYYYIFRDIE